MEYSTIVSKVPSEAGAWWSAVPDDRRAEEWSSCERGDWMLWVLAKMGRPHRLIVRAACECARLVLPQESVWPYGEAENAYAVRAIDAAEAWSMGNATIEQVRRDAADAEAGAGSCLYAATHAARACNDAYHAWEVADIAGGAGGAWGAGHSHPPQAEPHPESVIRANTARLLTLKICAGFVRRRFPDPPPALV